MRDDEVRAGLNVSALSFAWTVLSSIAAIGIGVTSESLVLVAFGATGVLDAVGSATLVAHYRHALRHASVSERRERVALQVITIGLMVLAFLTAAESVRRLAQDAHPAGSRAGIVIAGVSVGALGWLGVRKRRIGRRMPSPALVADGLVSLTGALLAGVTLIGTAVTAQLGWSWVDPIAALGVAVGAMVIARELRGEI